MTKYTQQILLLLLTIIPFNLQANTIDTWTFYPNNGGSEQISGEISIDITTQTLLTDTLQSAITSNVTFQSVWTIGTLATITNDIINNEIVLTSTGANSYMVYASLTILNATTTAYYNVLINLSPQSTEAFETIIMTESSTAVPEPASVALLATGLIGFAASRRVVGQVSA